MRRWSRTRFRAYSAQILFAGHLGRCPRLLYSAPLALSLILPQNVTPACINKCSTIGPKLSAGKNVSAPTMTITLTRSVVNSGVVTGNVPSDGGTKFLLARFPAIANIGMIMKNRPTSIAMPIVVLYQSVFAEIPAKAEPLFPVPEVNA